MPRAWPTPFPQAAGLDAPHSRRLTALQFACSLRPMNFLHRLAAIAVLPRLKISGIGLAALAVALAIGYWGYRSYAKSQLQRAVVELVRDSSERLQAAFSIETAAPGADNPQTVATLDNLAQEVDKHVIELNRMSALPNRPLVDAAEEYLLTARQILRNQAASHRYALQVAASDRALRDHMRSSNRRSGAWIQEALRAKERLEKDYFDYRLSAEALNRLLDSFPETRKRLAQHVATTSLTDETSARNARRRAAENLKRVAGEVERARQLAAVR